MISNTTHSSEWLNLYKIMCGKQRSLKEVERDFADVINQSQRRVEAGSVEADWVGALLRTMESSFTEGSLMSTLGAA